MALNVTRLSASIFAKLTSDPRNGFCDPLSPAQEDMLRTWCDAIADAVITEITTSAVVSVATPSGPGTGTVT